MSDAAKKILAYQQTPLVFSCAESGTIPDDFLVSLTADEQTYIEERMRSPVEELFFELLPMLGAAGISPSIHPLLCDVHRQPARIHKSVDGISLSLADMPSTVSYLKDDFVDSFLDELDVVLRKTEQRFGSAHLVVLAALPRFSDGRLVDDDLVTFGEPLLEGAAHELEYLQEFYEKSLAQAYGKHTLLGVNLRCFQTPTLRESLLERFKRLKTKLVVQ